MQDNLLEDQDIDAFPRAIVLRAIIDNVGEPDLVSKEWCDLIFENRNKDYGAYLLRREARKRHARAFRFLLLLLLVSSLFFLVPLLYTGYQYKMALDELKDELPRMEKVFREEERELKAVSAGRGMPRVSTVKGAVSRTPDIVDFTPPPVIFGKAGPETVELEESIRKLADADTLHNRDKEDLPLEGVQLRPVEVVEQMPGFPGGPAELMKWLDRNISYPRWLVEKKVEGDAEISFLVDADGRVRNAEVTRSLHPELDRLALAAVRRMPKWEPGKVDGKVSVVKVTIPIEFRLK